VSDYITTTLREGSESIAWAATPAQAPAIRERGDRRRHSSRAGQAVAAAALVAAGAAAYPVASAISQAPAPAAAARTVPEVTGDTLPQAMRALSGAGLAAGRVRAEHSTSIAVHLVIGTEPAAGARVPKGADVVILVSDGGTAVVLPDVIGESQAAAVAQLAQLGLKVEIRATARGTVAGRTAARGTVVRQSPPGLSVQQTGFTVVLYVMA
jgi:eukaryotic-like serine/threonine-protein kinase